MEETVAIIQIGEQNQLPVSDAFMKQLGWKAGDQVELVFENGRLRITKLEDGSGQVAGS